jgi:hypothetical protein
MIRLTRYDTDDLPLLPNPPRDVPELCEAPPE